MHGMDHPLQLQIPQQTSRHNAHFDKVGENDVPHRAFVNIHSDSQQICHLNERSAIDYDVRLLRGSLNRLVTQMNSLLEDDFVRNNTNAITKLPRTYLTKAH